MSSTAISAKSVKEEKALLKKQQQRTGSDPLVARKEEDENSDDLLVSMPVSEDLPDDPVNADQQSAHDDKKNSAGVKTHAHGVVGVESETVLPQERDNNNNGEKHRDDAEKSKATQKSDASTEHHADNHSQKLSTKKRSKKGDVDASRDEQTIETPPATVTPVTAENIAQDKQLQQQKKKKQKNATISVPKAAEETLQQNISKTKSATTEKKSQRSPITRHKTVSELQKPVSKAISRHGISSPRTAKRGPVTSNPEIPEEDNDTETGASGVRQRRRWRPGTVALREIRKAQKGGEFLIPKAPFIRCVRETVNLLSSRDNLRLTKNSVAALQEAAEAFLVEMFGKSQTAAIHAGRITVSSKDLALLRSVNALSIGASTSTTASTAQ